MLETAFLWALSVVLSEISWNSYVKDNTQPIARNGHTKMSTPKNYGCSKNNASYGFFFHEAILMIL